MRFLTENYYFRETPEKKFLDIYLNLRQHGFNHAQAKNDSKAMVNYDFNENAFKSRLKQFKMIYGMCMYFCFVFTAIFITYGFYVNAVVLILVIVFLYKNLMGLRKYEDLMED